MKSREKHAPSDRSGTRTPSSASRNPIVKRASTDSTVNPLLDGIAVAVVPCTPPQHRARLASPVGTARVAGAVASNQFVGALSDTVVLDRWDDAGRGGSNASSDGKDGTGTHGEG